MEKIITSPIKNKIKYPWWKYIITTLLLVIILISMKIPDNNNLYFLGDSIGDSSRNDISSALARNGWIVTIEAFPGRKLVASPPKSGMQKIEEDRNIIKDAEVIVIELGTNDWLRTSNDFKDHLNRLYSRVKSVNDTAKYYWVDYAYNRKISFSNKMTERNNDLREFVLGKNITIINWSSIGLKYLSSDGFHPSDNGKKALGELITNTIGVWKNN